MTTNDTLAAFTTFTICPVADVGGYAEKVTAEEAHFWTLYGVNSQGEETPISNLVAQEDAENILALIQALQG